MSKSKVPPPGIQTRVFAATSTNSLSRRATTHAPTVRAYFRLSFKPLVVAIRAEMGTHPPGEFFSRKYDPLESKPFRQGSALIKNSESALGPGQCMYQGAETQALSSYMWLYLPTTFYKMSKNMVQRTIDRDLPNVPSLHFRHRNADRYPHRGSVSHGTYKYSSNNILRVRERITTNVGLPKTSIYVHSAPSVCPVSPEYVSPENVYVPRPVILNT